MSERSGMSSTELAINTFVDKIEEIHPNLDREEFHEAVSGYVQEYVREAGEEEESEEGS